MNLEELGWNTFFKEHFAPFAQMGLMPGRISIEFRAGYGVYTAQGEMPAELSGKFRHQATGSAAVPVVGDWVAVQISPGENKAIIQGVLARQSKFSRKAAGVLTEEQILAANIDVVFIVVSLQGRLNPRGVERYLSLAWESGAQPVIALTKSDLCSDPRAAVRHIQAVSRDTPIHAVSSVTGQGMEVLKPYFQENRTVVLLGPSGVGKSTLINHLYGEELLPVQEVRERDLKGRHTTTHRELIRLPGGGLIVDTPGMRELQLWDAPEGVEATFAEVEALATSCRFTNCRHETEPNCAVRAAIAAGTIDPKRLESYRKLKQELHLLELKRSRRTKAQDKGKPKTLGRSPRPFKKGSR